MGDWLQMDLHRVAFDTLGLMPTEDQRNAAECLVASRLADYDSDDVYARWFARTNGDWEPVTLGEGRLLYNSYMYEAVSRESFPEPSSMLRGWWR